MLLVLVLSFSQYGGLLAERIFGQTGQHRRHRGLLRPQRNLGRPVRRHVAEPDHLHHRFRLECLLVHAVPLLAAQSLLRAVVQPRPGRPVLRQLPAVLRDRARAARQPRRPTPPHTRPAHRLRASAALLCAARCSSSTCTSRGSSSGCTPASSCAWCCASSSAGRASAGAACPRPCARAARARSLWLVRSARARSLMSAPQDLHRRARLLRPAVGRGRSEVHRRRDRAARAAGARLARSRPRRLDDRVTTTGRAHGAWSTASPPSRRTSAMAACRACASSIHAPRSCFAR